MDYFVYINTVYFKLKLRLFIKNAVAYLFTIIVNIINNALYFSTERFRVLGM